MILSKDSILKNINDNKIQIETFNKAQLNPNSYDVTLGNRLLVYKENFVDTSKKNPTDEITISEKGFELKKNHFYVGHIAEYIGSDCFVPILHGKTSIAKLGLFIHITANLIDIGNHCNFSLQLYPTENIVVYPGMRIAQISFWKVLGDVKLYNGKYKGVVGPASSQSFKHSKK